MNRLDRGSWSPWIHGRGSKWQTGAMITSPSIMTSYSVSIFEFPLRKLFVVVFFWLMKLVIDSWFLLRFWDSLPKVFCVLHPSPPPLDNSFCRQIVSAEERGGEDQTPSNTIKINFSHSLSWYGRTDSLSHFTFQMPEHGGFIATYAAMGVFKIITAVTGSFHPRTWIK